MLCSNECLELRLQLVIEKLVKVVLVRTRANLLEEVMDVILYLCGFIVCVCVCVCV